MVKISFIGAGTYMRGNRVSVISIIFKIFKFKFLGNFYPNWKKSYTLLYEQCNFDYFHCLQIKVVGQIQWQFQQSFNQLFCLFLYKNVLWYVSKMWALLSKNRYSVGLLHFRALTFSTEKVLIMRYVVLL